MRRCDKPSVAYHNGFRVCAEHKAAMPQIFWLDGTFGAGVCDQPIETKEQFWARVKDGRDDELHHIACGCPECEPDHNSPQVIQRDERSEDYK